MTSYQRRKAEAKEAERVLSRLRDDALTLSHAWLTVPIVAMHDVESCGCPACSACRRVQGIPLRRSQLRLSGVG
jgi:hypothetical protein